MTNTPKPSEADLIESLTPGEIVEYLNRYIVGQDKAKRAIAVALRTRWRRQQLPPDLSEEIIPKNILIIGPTGVGKTELARRIAKLTRSPFVKVEASKFTEVGYVGRDVESMIRDLTDVAVNMVKAEQRQVVREKARTIAEERLVDILYPPPVPIPRPHSVPPEMASAPDHSERTRAKIMEQLQNGNLDDRSVDVEVKENFGGMIEVFSSSGMEEIGMHLKNMAPGMFNQKKKRRRMTVGEARDFLQAEEEDRLVDMDRVIQSAIRRVENSGIIFIDEIDKIAGKEGGIGPDVSREGVQRDLLPVIEGSTVSTKYGIVRTDHILFFGSGAFHVTKPSDLIPELQGRFPVKVDVQSLTRDQMRRILVEPENALVKQYQALMKTEGVHLVFDEKSLDRIAALAEEVNEASENIGARRLHNVMELLLEEISFHATSLAGQTIQISAEYVDNHISVDGIIHSENIRKKRAIGFKSRKSAS